VLAPTLTLDIVHMDGRRIRFRRDDGSVVVHALGTDASRTLDVTAARRFYEQLEARGFSPVAEAGSPDAAAFFAGTVRTAPAELNRVVILVRDLGAQVRFYEQALGAAPRERDATHAIFGGSFGIELRALAALPSLAAAGQTVLPVLQVSDRRAAAALLAAAGATVQPGGSGPAPFTVVSDPEGHVWLLVERT
jgi:catechol 2,3-dioxygenase-like lactoylglutathione lyase family enzyme